MSGQLDVGDCLKGSWGLASQLDSCSSAWDACLGRFLMAVPDSIDREKPRGCPCLQDPLVDSASLGKRTDGKTQEHRCTLLGRGVQQVALEFEHAVGTWVGCDWPTRFGRSALDLNGWNSQQAAQEAERCLGTQAGQDWFKAVSWLEEIEREAAEAEAEALFALAASVRGDWSHAVQRARLARVLEFASGRPVRRGLSTWEAFYRAVLDAAAQHGVAVHR